MQGTMYSYNTEKKVEKKRTSLFGLIVLIGLGILLLLRISVCLTWISGNCSFASGPSSLRAAGG